MPDRSVGLRFRFPAIVTALLLAGAVQALSAAEIVKPSDGDWIQADEVRIIVRGADVQLFLDGQPVIAEEPFPGVFHADVAVKAGSHVVRAESPEGVQTAGIFVGDEPPAEGGRPHVEHPPVRVECSTCHSVSSRGRFRFSGGCEACHDEARFIASHSHQPHELASCGMCHDAHGSSTDQLLILSKDVACKQCHN